MVADFNSSTSIFPYASICTWSGPCCFLVNTRNIQQYNHLNTGQPCYDLAGSLPLVSPSPITDGSAASFRCIACTCTCYNENVHQDTAKIVLLYHLRRVNRPFYRGCRAFDTGLPGKVFDIHPRLTFERQTLLLSGLGIGRWGRGCRMRSLAASPATGSNLSRSNVRM